MAAEHFVLTRPAPGYLRAVCERAATGTDELVAEIAEICDAIVADRGLRVLVLSASSPDYFVARYDFAPSAALAGPSAPLHAFAQAAARLSRSDVISIASLRGRARGLGSELALACDLRFASIENCVLGQPEVPSGLLPAGGGIERLVRLVGRARATEIVVTGDDYDALTAERYGWINRAVPDADLDAFVDRMARRIASFDKVAVATAKGLLGRGDGNVDTELRQTMGLLPSVALSSRQRRDRLRVRAEHAGSDFELRLGHHLGSGETG